MPEYLVGLLTVAVGGALWYRLGKVEAQINGNGKRLEKMDTAVNSSAEEWQRLKARCPLYGRRDEDK